MQHLNSIRAALKANGTAPVLAIPVPGHAPICVRAKLLKGALKGVTIDSVKVLPNRWLKVTGVDMRNGGLVKTSSSFAPMERNTALRMIWDWSEKEHKRRIKVINQGVLSAKEQRALKLKAAEKAGVAELIEARKEEAEIIAKAKASVFPVITPIDTEERSDLIAEYSAFHNSLPNRKRGSVIRWKLAKLREQVKGMTKVQCEYNVLPPTGWSHRSRKTLKSKTLVLRKQKDKLKYAGLLYQIGQLEKQFESLYPPVWKEWNYDGEDHRYKQENWITKKPKGQSYSVPWSWRDADDEDKRNEGTVFSRLVGMANRLKDARANIRALTPPNDDLTEDMPVAA